MAISVLSVSVLVGGTASADTYVYHDPDYDFSASFADTWRKQTPDTATTRLRVSPVTGVDMVSCRVKVEDDGRALIYPERYMDEAVPLILNEEYWDRELGQFENSRLIFSC